MATKTPGFKGLQNETDESEDEYTPLYDDFDDLDERTAQETKGWNLFREIPVKTESGSMVDTEWVETSVKFMKFLAYIIVFLVILGTAVVSKGTLLFITSQLKKGREFIHCNKRLQLDQQFVAEHSLEERITWLWAALIVYAVPELGTFLRSARFCFFKTAKAPSLLLFLTAFLIETLNAIGTSVFVLMILPELDVLKGAMVMNAFCIIPGVLNALSRDMTKSHYYVKIVLDVFAISAQLTAFFVWPLLDGSNVMWTLPAACLLMSLGWWENFVETGDEEPSFVAIEYLQDLRRNLKETRYYTHRFLSLWKIIIFMGFVLISLHIQDDDPLAFFTKCLEAFQGRFYIVQEVQVLLEDLRNGVVEFVYTGETLDVPANPLTSLWVALIQVLSAYICFGAAKFACKIMIQSFSFTFALSLVGPVSVNLLLVFAGLKNQDTCAFFDWIPDNVFFEMPPVHFLGEFITRERVWVWLLWLVSQAWVTAHTWRPRCERLASTDKLFAKPWYNGALVDLSLLLNRTKDRDTEISVSMLNDNDSMMSGEKITKDSKPSDSVTRVYICATMWHENREEMIDFLKSLMRLDEDQSARRVAQKYLGIVDPDYYELEAHIFMDDSFDPVGKIGTEDAKVNRFVKCLIDCIDEAASEVHLTNVQLRPPKKYPTPYGGRLVWTLPGKNRVICHLKDKMKIRHRKRWSQVMYMYYFLGHRLMDLPITVDRKEVIAENTYLLALDGDIDFKPAALTLLIDLMKKDKNLGAACGRIHPVGSGFMAWYQMFEYAIGHWLQKATEHMIGCVLCSPGCFSLFRGKALMDDNVMRKYTIVPTEARHFVQYDQGEDRWLCTLLLQRGYRVEYSAASDAYTHCPELFNEFFNQRRRWIPSTMANILDLLQDSKRTVKVNDNISTLYIVYQSLLMVGTILGPGTIFLMMIGALNAITGLSNIYALYINLVPIVIFIAVCMTCKSEIQLMLANAITIIYVMVMIMVIVGIALQIVEDGWLAPSSMFFVMTFGTFFITAALHPQEFICLLYLIIYYITIPSMYMLLIIYSLCNLNNVTWGTRETPQQKSPKEIEEEMKAAEEAKKEMESKSLLRFIGKSDEESGSMEIGIAGLFRCICCTNPKDFKDDIHLLKLSHSLEKIERKLDSLGADDTEMSEKPRPSFRREPSVMMQPFDETSEISAEMPREEIRDVLINPYWIEDNDLRKGEVDFLTTAEIRFWEELIEKYLHPIDTDKEEQTRVANDLKELRNKMVFAFLMLNTLFVLIIFLLQLNQEQLHFQWPLGQEVTLDYDSDNNVVIIDQEYLMLEPIGSMFVIFFGTVMLIQFSGMLFHRMGTLTHLLAATELDWFFTKRPDEMTDGALLEKHAIDLVKDLQRLNTDDMEQHGIDEGDLSRRKTLNRLEQGRATKSAPLNLDANFKRRLTMLQNNDSTLVARLSHMGPSLSVRRATIRAVTTRRESVLAEKRRSQVARDSQSGFLYDMPNTSMSDMPARQSTSGYLNKSYEPAYDSSEDEGPRTRPSTVRFREFYA